MAEVCDTTAAVKHSASTIKLVKAMLAGTITEVTPARDLTSQLGFTYPHLESLLQVTTQQAHSALELLADEGVLEKHFYDRLLFCPHCQSSNLRPGLGCPECGSGNITRGRILEHLPCRHNDLEEGYVAGSKYLCPQCQQELRFLGTDYQSLGINYKCHDCGAISNEASPYWQCLHCSRLFSEDKARETLLYCYRFNETKRRRLEFEFDTKPVFVDFLKSRGYRVTENAIVNGTSKSGAGHVIDILAQQDNGLVSYTLAIGIAIDGNSKEIGLDEVFRFDNKCYDLGIHDKILLVDPRLSEPAQQFARRQRITVLQNSELEALLASTPDSSPPRSRPSRFNNMTQLLEYLNELGYKVEEKARARGRSGLEHTFDILAYKDDGIIIHTLGISILTAKDEVGFDAVSSFDTRAYDAAIHDKLLLVSPRLSQDARQFARYQGIKVIELQLSSD